MTIRTILATHLGQPLHTSYTVIRYIESIMTLPDTEFILTLKRLMSGVDKVDMIIHDLLNLKHESGQIGGSHKYSIEGGKVYLVYD